MRANALEDEVLVAVFEADGEIGRKPKRRLLRDHASGLAAEMTQTKTTAVTASRNAFIEPPMRSIVSIQFVVRQQLKKCLFK